MVKSMVMVVPEITIPELEFPGGFELFGLVSSELTQEVKNAAPSVEIIRLAPAFSINFLRDSVRFPDLVRIGVSIVDSFSVTLTVTKYKTTVDEESFDFFKNA